MNILWTLCSKCGLGEYVPAIQPVGIDGLFGHYSGLYVILIYFLREALSKSSSAALSKRLGRGFFVRMDSSPVESDENGRGIYV